jgi:hypothetical protein
VAKAIVAQNFAGYAPERQEEILKEYLQSLRNWISTTEKKGTWERYRSDIVTEAAERDVVLRTIGVSMTASVLAPYVCGKGALNVIDGNRSGWASIQCALRYQYWWNRSDHAVAIGMSYSPVRYLPGSFYNVLHTSLAAYFLGDAEVAAWFFKLLIAMERNGTAAESVNDHSYTEYTTAFARAIIENARPRSTNWKAPSPLTDLIDAWDDASKLQALLPIAIDYHLWRGDQRRKAKNPDIDYHVPGYLLFPVPVLAFLKLREQHGLPPINFDHPLMKLPICDVPRTGAPGRDSVVELVESAVLELEKLRGRAAEISI